MATRHALLPALGIALFLGGCSFAGDALWPALTGERSDTAQAPAPTAVIADPAAQRSPAPVQTGTTVGQRVVAMRTELGQLQAQLGQQTRQLETLRATAVHSAQRYHGTIAAITARLQMGTTPGNPILTNQWTQAQNDLNRLATDVAAMNTLSGQVSNLSSTAAFLLDNTRASFALPGAIDEDHVQLRQLQDETQRTVVSIDRLLTELQEDITRQTNYIGGERQNLAFLSTSIANGEMAGPNLRARAINPTVATVGTTEPIAPRAPGQGAALAIIKFDNPNLQYEQALYSAIAQALERRPNASFEVVAVPGVAGGENQVGRNQTEARRYAERVMRSLTNMGLPPQRVVMSMNNAASVPTNEVHVFVR